MKLCFQGSLKLEDSAVMCPLVMSCLSRMQEALGASPAKGRPATAGLCLYLLSSESPHEPRQAGYVEASPGKKKGRVGRRLEAMLKKENRSSRGLIALGFLGLLPDGFRDSRLHVCANPLPQIPGSSLFRLHDGLIHQWTQT